MALEVAVPLLTSRTALSSPLSGDTYELESRVLHRGGFGEVYRGRSNRHGNTVCLKAMKDAASWHGEAFFGDLLKNHPQLVRWIDAFPVTVSRGRARQLVYVLVFEWMDGGALFAALARHGRWDEALVERELRNLLRFLRVLHARGICHGDI